MRALTSFILLILVAASGAVKLQDEWVSSSPSIAYWYEKLPTTPIPESLWELISPDYDDENVPKEGVHIKSRRVGVPSLIRLVQELENTPKTENPPDKNPDPDENPLFYSYYTASPQKPRDPSHSAFLLEKDLVSGTRKYLSFSNTQKMPKFLPRSLADEIRFSSNKLSAVLKELNIAQDSVMGLAMKQNLQACEAHGVKGETKYCATSLESMIDYITSKLGSNRVTVLATNVPKTSKSVKQEYSITGAQYESQGEKPVYVCHTIKYAYAVYYCHELQGTKVARVWVKGEDGSTVEAATICHIDTSAWNPKHMAFQVLKVKPGAACVCHFLPENHFVWLGAN